MKKFFSILLFLFSLAASAQTPLVPYEVTTISAMKSYAGYANWMHVTATNENFILCPTCTADESTVYAGANTRKWKKIVPSFSTITGKPTTIAGYSITDAYTQTQINSFFSGGTSITGYSKTNWDAAFGWGNHASAGYVTTNIYNSDGTITDGTRTIKGNRGVFNIDSVTAFQINPNYGNNMTVATDYFLIYAGNAGNTRYTTLFGNTTSAGGNFQMSGRGQTTIRFDSSIHLSPLDSFFVDNILRRSRTTDKALVYDTATHSFGFTDFPSGSGGDLSGYLQRGDSTIYGTKANTTKAKDSVVGLLSNYALASSLLNYLQKSDSTIYSTKANGTKQRDSVVALLANYVLTSTLSSYLQKSDSTIYGTKANTSKARDSVVALLANYALASSLAAYLQKSDSTIYGTKANTTKAKDSVVGLLGNYLQNITGLITQGTNVTITGTGTAGSPYVISSTGASGGLTIGDSTIYSTKANTTKAKDSVVALLANYVLTSALSSYLQKSDSTIYSTKANGTKQRDSVVALLANYVLTSTLSSYLQKSDSTIYSTKANTTKAKDSVVALLANYVLTSTLSSYLQKSDSTIYSTKANTTKAKDSVVALLASYALTSSLSSYLQKSDSTIYSTKANTTKARDSVVALLSNYALVSSLSSYLQKSDSTIYSTKANGTKQRDSVVALLSNYALTSTLSSYLQKSDSTIYGTKANTSKARDSVVALLSNYALVSSLSSYLQKSDSTIYSTKANGTKQRDSVVSLLSSYALTSSLSSYLQKSDSTIYSTKANTTKAKDSVIALLVNYLKYSDSTIYSTKANTTKARDSVVALLANYKTTTALLSTLYNKGQWSSMADWANSGSITSSASSNNINITNTTPGSNSEAIDNTAYGYTCLEYERLFMRYTLNSSTSSTSWGAGIGIRSTSGATNNVYARFNSSTDATYGGHLTIIGTYPSATVLVSSTDTLNFANADSLETTFERDANTIVATARNGKNNSKVLTVSYTFDTGTSGLPLLPNTGKFAIFACGGSQIIDSVNIFSKEITRPDWLFEMDSKGVGYYSPYTSRAVDQIKASIPNLVVHAGGGNRTADELSDTTEALLIAPKGILLEGGTNDADSTTTKTNLALLVTTYQNHGINVLLTSFYQPGNTWKWNWMLRTYPSSMLIDNNTPLQVYGAIGADNVHMTGYGDSLWANATIASGKLTGGGPKKIIPLPFDFTVTHTYTALNTFSSGVDAKYFNLSSFTPDYDHYGMHVPSGGGTTIDTHAGTPIDLNIGTTKVVRFEANGNTILGGGTSNPNSDLLYAPGSIGTTIINFRAFSSHSIIYGMYAHSTGTTISSYQSSDSIGMKINGVSIANFQAQGLWLPTKYINFGTTVGSGGYGFRDSSGILLHKSSNEFIWTQFSSGGGTTYTAGTGIDITSNVVSNNAYDKYAQASTTTSNGTTTTLVTISFSGAFTTSNGILEVSLVGTQQTSGAGITGKKYVRFNDNAGTITLGTIIDQAADEVDSGISGATWTIDQSSGTLRVRVTGLASNTIIWKCAYKVVQQPWFP